MFIMDLNKLSENAIKLLYNAINDALIEDDALSTKKIYGVREYPDFKEFADMLEQIMINRNISFQKIVW